MEFHSDPQAPTQEAPPEVGTLPIDPEPAPEPPPPAPPPPPKGRAPKGTNPVMEFLDRLQALQEPAMVYVTRSKRGGGSQHVTTQNADAFDLDYIQTKHGGGKFTFTVKDADQQYLFTQTLEVSGQPKNPKIPDEDPDTRSTLQLVEGLRQDVGAAFQGLRNPPPETKDANSLELALSIVGAFQSAQAPYLEALLKKTKDGPDTAEMMELFFKGMEFAQTNAPGADPMMGVVSQLALPLLQGLAPGGDPAPPAPAHQPNPPEGEPMDAPRRPPWDMMLAPWLPHLQTWASKGKDPGMRADFVIDEVPTEAVDLIGEQLARGEPFLAEFFVLHPETKAFEGWYREFWAGIADGIEWEADPDTLDTEPPDGEYVETVEVEADPEV